MQRAQNQIGAHSVHLKAISRIAVDRNQLEMSFSVRETAISEWVYVVDNVGANKSVFMSLLY